MRSLVEQYQRITTQWSLTQAERRSLLGSPSLERWSYLVHDPMRRPTSTEAARILAVLRIDTALQKSAKHLARPAHWLNSLQISQPFGGCTPLALMVRGPEGLAVVADFLETK
jgi:hypothetical protein